MNAADQTKADEILSAAAAAAVARIAEIDAAMAALNAQRAALHAERLSLRPILIAAKKPAPPYARGGNRGLSESIRNHLSKHPGSTLHDLDQVLGGPLMSVNSCVHAMWKRGVLVREGRPFRYSLRLLDGVDLRDPRWAEKYDAATNGAPR